MTGNKSTRQKGAATAASRNSRIAQHKADDRHFVAALARGLEVLACFRAGDGPLSNQEIAQRCHLPKSTVSRLISTLTRLGYVVTDENTGKYQLGIATLSLGVSMLAKLDIRQVARPLMQEIADFAQASVSLAVRDRLSMLYIEHCRSRAALTLSLDVGSRVPIASSAIGRAHLAHADISERNEIIDRISELDPQAAEAVVRALEQAQKDHEQYGCATSFGEWNPNVNAIAVSLPLGSRFPAMALNCGGPAFQLSPEFLLEKVAPKLRKAAQKLSESVSLP